MSLVSMLSIARSALLAQQRAMAVTAHNVANAQTPGYSRQRLDLVASDPLRLPSGMLGRGVDALGVSRARDTLLDVALRTDTGSLGHASTRLDLLSGVEGALLEPSDQGVAAAFDGLLQAFADLANDPASGAQRELVRSAGQRFVSEVHRVNDAIDAAEAQALERLRHQVDDVNRLAGQVAELNQQLVGQSTDAPDLFDRRDLLLDQLAGYGAVRVQPQADGSVTVILGEHVLVEGARAHALEAMPSGGGWGVGRPGTGTPLDLGAGSLAALSDLLTNAFPAMHARLNEFVSTLATEFNAVHAAGYTLGGATGVDFFDLATPDAGALGLDASVTASGDAIAAGGTAAPGDGNNALALAALGGKAIPALAGRTLRQHYELFAAEVGTAAADADRDVSVSQALVDRDETRRQSVSGVSVDEEMVNLIGQQQAYQAAARIVKVADEMIQVLMGM